jgi:ABC-type oligopeptide transport system ATPase subunit
MQFKKATKERAKLRLGLVGPSGSGKTMTALRIARGLVGAEGRIAVRDSEHGSASKYADRFEFDVIEPDSHSPQDYVDTIDAAAKAGYAVVILDSLSHAWMGKDGALEQVDRKAARSQGNTFVGWRDVTPLHNRMVDAIIGAPIHVIATMRSKTEWVLEENERGKKVPRKIGMQPIQRDGMDYEFDVVADLDHDHRFVVGKTRCEALDGYMSEKAGEREAEILLAWLAGAEPQPKAAKVSEPAARSPQPNVSEADTSSSGRASDPAPPPLPPGWYDDPIDFGKFKGWTWRQLVIGGRDEKKAAEPGGGRWSWLEYMNEQLDKPNKTPRDAGVHQRVLKTMEAISKQADKQAAQQTGSAA